MKAFQQINLNIESRLVFSYAAILCFVCSLIILNPLFGQEQEQTDTNRPEVKIDVQKEFDIHGNVIGFDSSYSWYWPGEEIIKLNLDSIFESFQDDFGDWQDYFNRNNFQPFGQSRHPDWQSNDSDSILNSQLNDLFDDGFADQFDFNNWDFQFQDSIISSYFDFEGFSQNFNENQEGYIDRLKKYQKEHQQLIEKYFGKPAQEDAQEDDKDIEYKQQKNTPIKINPNNTDRV